MPGLILTALSAGNQPLTWQESKAETAYKELITHTMRHRRGLPHGVPHCSERSWQARHRNIQPRTSFEVWPCSGVAGKGRPLSKRLVNPHSRRIVRESTRYQLAFAGDEVDLASERAHAGCIYDLRGTDHDTAAFAVNTIRSWWNTAGRTAAILDCVGAGIPAPRP